MLFKKFYEETEDGEIVEKFAYKGEELAKKTDVYEYYIKAKAYTDSFDARSKVALGISIASFAMSLVSVFLQLLT